MRHRHWSLSLIGWGFIFTLLLSACTAPAQPASPPTAAPTTQSPTGPPPAGLQLAHLQQAAYNYNRYHKLAPDDLLGLKRLTEVCTAMEQAGVEDENCREAAGWLTRAREERRTRRHGDGQALKVLLVFWHAPRTEQTGLGDAGTAAAPRPRGVKVCVTGQPPGRVGGRDAEEPRSRGDRCSVWTDALISLRRTSEL